MDFLKLRKLSPQDWMTLPAAWLSLHRAYFASGVKLAGEDSVTADESARTEARRLYGLVESAARLSPLPLRCLPRALALQDLLRRRKIPARLKIGVTNQFGFRAHAWVEVGGAPIGEAANLNKFHELRGA